MKDPKETGQTSLSEDELLKTGETAAHGRPASWDIFVLYLLMCSLIPMFALSFYEDTMTSSTKEIVFTADALISATLMTDFFMRLGQSKSKVKFMRWGWIDFIGCIPFFLVPFAEWFRWLRLIRLVLIIKRLSAAGQIVGHMFHNPLVGTVYTTIMLGCLIILLGSELVFLAENGIEGSLIHSYADALWWTITTLTTVGYGDIYPVSWGGRIVAAFLMLFGIALYGSVTTMISQLVAQAVRKKSRGVDNAMVRKLVDKIERAELNDDEKRAVIAAASDEVEAILQKNQDKRSENTK